MYHPVLSVLERWKLMPGFTGCQASMHGQTSLLISRCTVTSKKFKCCWGFIHCTHTLESEMAVKSYTLGPVVLKMSCFFSEMPVSVGVNVIFKGSLSQKGDQDMQHKSLSAETLILESLWWVNKTPVLNLARIKSLWGKWSGPEFQPVPHQHCLMDFHV